MQKIQLLCQREERLALVRSCFPEASGPDLPLEWAGGRVNALKKLQAVNGERYGRNRNFLDGDVTGLSPYLRHGCLTLIEAINSVKSRFGNRAEKLLFEFAWRDYWRQVWYLRGDDIRSDMEAPKVSIGRNAMPQDILQAETGLPCMDAFISDLVNIGYVHNHARMWFASYAIHHRKLDWRAAADWYESHLLDGDRASNSLSWQWVASTFGSKAYIFSKENLSRYSNNRYCQGCEAHCPFDDNYEALSQKLFSPTTAPAKTYKIQPLPAFEVKSGDLSIVLVHDEMLSAAHPLMHSADKKVFIFDPALHGDWALHRLQFVADCLIELEEVEVWIGDTREVLSNLEVNRVKTQATPNPTLQALLASYKVDYLPEPSIADVSLRANDLRRFSKYWEKVGPHILAS